MPQKAIEREAPAILQRIPPFAIPPLGRTGGGGGQKVVHVFVSAHLLMGRGKTHTIVTMFVQRKRMLIFRITYFQDCESKREEQMLGECESDRISRGS